MFPLVSLGCAALFRECGDVSRASARRTGGRPGSGV